MEYTTKYTPPTLTIDLIYFEVRDDKLCVLLHNRPEEPFKGMWALPGGYVPNGETTKKALRRIVSLKTGVDTESFGYLEQSYAFDTVAQDPRGHAVSVTYIGAGHNISIEKNATEAAFFPVDELPEVAYDHQDIIRFARQKLVEKICVTNLISVFLPTLFTMSNLQKTYEAALDKKLDKRNFQKKVFKLDFVVETDKLFYNANSRPAKLYKFKTKSINPLNGKFD